MTFMRSIAILPNAVCLLMALLNLPVSAKAGKKLPLGLWGGQHVSFHVSSKGATIEYDCAHGTINQSIVLDANGRFNVPGRHVPERGGPSRQGAQRGYSVTFSGEVKGRTMMLTVRNSATNEEIGSFNLIHGGQPKLFKCL